MHYGFSIGFAFFPLLTANNSIVNEHEWKPDTDRQAEGRTESGRGGGRGTSAAGVIEGTIKSQNNMKYYESLE